MREVEHLMLMVALILVAICLVAGYVVGYLNGQHNHCTNGCYPSAVEVWEDGKCICADGHRPWPRHLKEDK